MAEQQEWLSDFAYGTLVNIGKAGTMFTRQELAANLAWGLTNPDKIIDELLDGRYIIHSSRSSGVYVLVSNPVTTRVAGSAILRRAPKINPWVSVPPEAIDQSHPYKEPSAMDKTIEQIFRETNQKYSGPGNAHRTLDDIHQSCIEHPQPGMFRGYREVMMAIMVCSLAAIVTCSLIVGVGWGFIAGVAWLLESSNAVAFALGGLVFMGCSTAINLFTKQVDADISRR